MAMARRVLEVELVGNGQQLQGVFGKASAGAAGFGKRMEAVGGTLSKRVTKPVLGVGIAAALMSVQFEDALDKIVGLVGVNREQVDKWGKEILALAPKVGKSPKELADALFFVTSAGFRGAAAMDVLKQSAKASAAGLGETKVIADGVTSAVNAYGLKNLSAGKAVDVLTASVRDGKVAAEDLAPVIGRVAPLAAQLGVRFDEVGAALASMTRVNGNASESATQLRGIFSTIIKPTKKYQEGLDSIGKSFHGVQAELKEKGLLATLLDLDRSARAHGKTLADVFGNVRALTGALGIAHGNLKATKGIFDDLSKSAGSTNRAFHVMADNDAGFKMHQALAAIEVDLIKLGNVILPIVAEGAEHLRHFANLFGQLPAPVKKTVLEVAGFAAALGPVLIVGGKVVGMFKLLGSTAVTGSNVAVGALSRLRAAWIALRFASAAGTAGLGATLGLALGAAFVGAYIGTMLRKIPAVRHAADAIAHGINDALGTGSSEAQKFDAQMQKITGSVEHLAAAFRKATNPVDKNTAGIKLHIVASKAAAAQFAKTEASLLAQGASMDGTNAKSQKLRAAVAGLKQAESDAASWAAALKRNLDALPASKTITVRINQRGQVGGGAFGINKPAKASQANPGVLFGLDNSIVSLTQQQTDLQAGFDTADQAARRAKDRRESRLKGKDNKGTVKSALQDLRALNIEIARAKALGAIDLKIKGNEAAIRFKNAIDGIRGSLKQATADAAAAFRQAREKAINKTHDSDLAAIKDSADAQELAQLQATDSKLADQKTLAENQKALDDANKAFKDAATDEEKAAAVQAQKDAQDAIDAYARQKREAELQANIDAAVVAADSKQQTALDGLDQEEADYAASLDKRLDLLADNLNAGRESYKQFVADVEAILGPLGLVFDTSSDVEQAILGNKPPKTKGKTKTKGKHRAMGGAVVAGQSYVVGESGMEMFTPDSDGQITPATRLRGVGDIYMTKYGDVKMNSPLDAERFAHKTAWRVMTGAR